MVRRLGLLLLIFLAGCAARTRRFVGYRFSGSAPVTECSAEGRARWCVHTPKGPASRDVLYFLHYATGDEGSWDRLGLARAFYGEYERLGKPAPRAVTVSYGPHWVVSGAKGLRQTVELSEFEAWRRKVEERLGPVERRYAWGMSQGGYNAAVVALSDPRTWSAVALSCPALYSTSPYKKSAGREVFIREEEGRQLFTSRLSDEAAWKAENPVALAPRAKGGPVFWIEANRDDEFGFHDGAVALEKALEAAGGKSELHEVPRGGHCFIDARAAARFIASQR
jgi:pimeloyl-ACP methyl ester carboxylesterase